MADEDTKDTGPGRDLTWGETVEERLAALEDKTGLAKAREKAEQADTKEEN